jgi:hypothetical protein
MDGIPLLNKRFGGIMKDPDCLPQLSGTEHGGQRLAACLRFSGILRMV